MLLSWLNPLQTVETSTNSQLNGKRASVSPENDWWGSKKIRKSEGGLCSSFPKAYKGLPKLMERIRTEDTYHAILFLAALFINETGEEDIDLDDAEIEETVNAFVEHGGHADILAAMKKDIDDEAIQQHGLEALFFCAERHPGPVAQSGAMKLALTLLEKYHGDFEITYAALNLIDDILNGYPKDTTSWLYPTTNLQDLIDQGILSVAVDAIRMWSNDEACYEPSLPASEILVKLTKFQGARRSLFEEARAISVFADVFSNKGTEAFYHEDIESAMRAITSLDW